MLWFEKLTTKKNNFNSLQQQPLAQRSFYENSDAPLPRISSQFDTRTRNACQLFFLRGNTPVGSDRGWRAYE